jgi:hypothetical protein
MLTVFAIVLQTSQLRVLATPVAVAFAAVCLVAVGFAVRIEFRERESAGQMRVTENHVAGHTR